VAWLPDQRMVFGLSEPPPSQGDLNLWWLKVNARSGAASGSPHRITRWTSASLLEPTASADGKRLVVANLSYQSDVFVARVASRDSMLQDVSRLTVDARFDVQPEWSPDGGSILFASDRNGSLDIFRQSPGSPDAEPVVTGPGEQVQPRVSPDGHWLLYLDAQASSGPGDVNRPGGPGSTERLRRMPIAGGAAETVCEVAAGSSFRCARSPASRCVMVEPAGGKSLAEAFDPLHGKIGELGTLELSALSAWDLSPDGSAIAYTDPGDTTTQIHVWSVADGARRAIRTSLRFGIAALAWDGAGTGWYAVGVMNQRGQGVRWQIFRIAPDGRAWSVLPPQMWMYGFSLSRDGRRIAFTSNTGQASAWLLENF
jgi:Tol biopolymer transport system component